MGQRYPNHRLVKLYRSYRVEEVASLFGKHKNTVRGWIKSGLPTIDGKRPTLVQGQELIAFLKVQRTKNKRPCQPGQIYCVRCRSPKYPAAGMADYLPITEKFGNLVALCPDCDSIMHRCVSLAKIEQIHKKMDITFPQALRHIREINQPTVNSDLRGDIQP